MKKPKFFRDWTTNKLEKELEILEEEKRQDNKSLQRKVQRFWTASRQ